MVRALLGLGTVGLLVGADQVVFRDRRWFRERLAVNVGIVPDFGAFHFRIAGRA